MAVDPSTTKFVIKASIQADGVVEKPDVIGAIFGQTEGLLGNEMDLRDLQKGARIGRIEVSLEQKNGKSTGTIELPSALDKVESAIMAAALETIDRIGPAKATVKVLKIEDARSSKREQVLARAKELLNTINDDPAQDSSKISDVVRSAVHVAEIRKFRGTKSWCGPNVENGDAIILVEGRSDVQNLLKFGIRNALSVEGTNIPDEIKELSKEKTTTIFVDGDRGGELIARELLETCEVDFVARAPKTREVEELPHKLVMKCLQNKLTRDQYVSQTGIKVAGDDKPARGRRPAKKETDEKPKGGRGRQTKDDEEKPARGRGRQTKDDGEEKPARGRGRQTKDDDADEKPARGRRTPKKDDDADEKPARGRGRQTKDDDGEKKPARGRKAPAKKPVKKGDDPRAGLRDSLAGLAGTLKATLLDDAGSALKEGLPVRELADNLKGGKDKIHTVIFDGVITQRLLDIAADKKVATLVGVKMGNVSKVPDTVEILTKDDLQ